METFSALLALCAGNSPVTIEFPSQKPVTRSFGIFFHLHLNKRLSKHSRRWWFATPSCSLWRHCSAPRKLGQHHGCWCTDASVHQTFSSYDIGHGKKTGPSLPWCLILDYLYYLSSQGDHPKYFLKLLFSTFSATNISSNMIWCLQLNDTIKMNSNHTGINNNHNNIAVRRHIMIYNSVWNLIFATKFSSIYLAKRQNVCFFNYHLLTCSVRKMVLICLMQNICMYLLYKFHQIARLNLVAKMKIYTAIYIIKRLLMAML